MTKKILSWLFLFFVPWCASVASSQIATDVTPEVTPAQSFKSRYPGIEAIWLSGPKYKGKPTRAAGYLGIPASATPENPVPAVVCVHGGGGTAFAEWVKLWNDAGYAAIALDLCGSIPVRIKGTKYPDWERHEDGGPRRLAIFQDYNENVEDQWMFHAISLVSRARQYLASLPEVKSDQIGVSGISWGGIITGNTIGRDNQFAFAILVYGCGYLDRIPNRYGEAFEGMPEPLAAQTAELWDPARHLGSSTVPSFWLNWTHDKHFYLPYWNASTKLPKGEVFRRIDMDMGHSHPRGYGPEEIIAFADYATGRSDRLPRVNLAADADAESWTLSWRGEVPVIKATLYQTCNTDLHEWPDFEWKETVFTLDSAKQGELRIQPAGKTSYFYVNVETEEGLFVSSELVNKDGQFSVAP